MTVTISSPLDIVIATNNRDKIREIRSILNLPQIRWRTLSEFPPMSPVVEDGNTLYENALKKARMISHATGLPALADDTGLEVDVLDGAPGIWSARWAGPQATYADNVRKMVEAIRNVEPGRRQARFRTVAVFVHQEEILKAEGVLEGLILDQPRGSDGFGYDPVFYIPAHGRTLAEMSLADKNGLSHRGLAFREIGRLLMAWLTAFNCKR